MGIRISTFLLLLAGTIYAEERYIVPVFSTIVEGPDRRYSSSVTLSNLANSPARIRIRSIPDDPGASPCLFDEISMFARETRTVWPRTQCAGQILALEMISDKPLLVRSHVQSLMTGANCNFTAYQEIAVAREWLPGGTEVTIPSFQQEAPIRANLVLINPNPVPIRVSLRIERLPEPETLETAIDLEANSLELMRLPEIPIKILCIRFPCAPEHRAYLKSTGLFHAGVSTIFPEGDALFYPAVLTEK